MNELGLTKPLTFEVVDGLAYAAERGRLDYTRLTDVYHAESLGPLVELAHLASQGSIPPLSEVRWLKLGRLALLQPGLASSSQRWVCPTTRTIMLLRGATVFPTDDWIAFAMMAKHAAVQSGCPPPLAAQLVAAFGELFDNTFQHSRAPESALGIFRCRRDAVEFTITDRGIGVLSSLRQNSRFAHLSDHGEALQLALQEGVTRYPDGSQHGHGYTDLLTGVANRQSLLRFRTGNHALKLDGRRVIPAERRAAQKAVVAGLVVSVECWPAQGGASI